jgi:hypothetical protein
MVKENSYLLRKQWPVGGKSYERRYKCLLTLRRQQFKEQCTRIGEK